MAKITASYSLVVGVEIQTRILNADIKQKDPLSSPSQTVKTGATPSSSFYNKKSPASRYSFSCFCLGICSSDVGWDLCRLESETHVCLTRGREKKETQERQERNRENFKKKKDKGSNETCLRMLR